MRHTAVLVLGCLLVAVALAACAGETGPQGKQGPKGNTGSQGPRGPAGQKGESGSQDELQTVIEIIRKGQARENVFRALSISKGSLKDILVGNIHMRIEIFNDAIRLDPASTLRYYEEPGRSFIEDGNKNMYYLRGKDYFFLGVAELQVSDDGVTKAAELINLAAKDFDDALRIGPPTFDLYCWTGYTSNLMGRIYEHLGKTVEANREYAKASREHAKASEMGYASRRTCPSLDG